MYIDLLAKLWYNDHKIRWDGARMALRQGLKVNGMKISATTKKMGVFIGALAALTVGVAVFGNATGFSAVLSNEALKNSLYDDNKGDNNLSGNGTDSKYNASLYNNNTTPAVTTVPENTDSPTGTQPEVPETTTVPEQTDSPVTTENTTVGTTVTTPETEQKTEPTTTTVPSTTTTKTERPTTTTTVTTPVTTEPPASTTHKTTTAETTTKKTTTTKGETLVISDDDDINGLLELVNDARADAGVGALKLNSDMLQMAQVRAKEIANVFDHYRPDGTKFSTIFDDFDVYYLSCAENITWGSSRNTPEEAFQAWWESDTHRATMLNSKYKYCAFAHYVKDGKHYWVQLFAKL